MNPRKQPSDTDLFTYMVMRNKESFNIHNSELNNLESFQIYTNKKIQSKGNEWI